MKTAIPKPYYEEPPNGGGGGAPPKQTRKEKKPDLEVDAYYKQLGALDARLSILSSSAAILMQLNAIGMAVLSYVIFSRLSLPVTIVAFVGSIGLFSSIVIFMFVVRVGVTKNGSQMGFSEFVHRHEMFLESKVSLYKTAWTITLVSILIVGLMVLMQFLTSPEFSMLIRQPVQNVK